MTRLGTSALRTTAVLALAALAASACTGTRAGAVAVVNGVKITDAEFEDVVLAIARDAQDDGTDAAQLAADLEGFQRQRLGQIIQRMLVEQIAEERGLTASEADVEELWQREVLLQGDEETFLAFLADIGLDEASAREQLRQEALITKLQDDVRNSIEISPADVEALYASRADQWSTATASHILLESAEEAQAVIDLIDRGDATFEELAQARSLDEVSGVAGGTLGAQPRGTFVEAFDEAVWSAVVGELVGPVETTFGFHVIRVDEFDERTINDVGEQLEAELRGAEFDRVFNEIIGLAFQGAEIEVDSRFGRWDSLSGQVVPDRPLDR